MFTEGIFPIGDGLLDIDETRLKGLLMQDDINEIYEVEQTPFARGKFAAVRRAVHKNSGVHFAAKFLKRRRRAQSSDKEIKHEIAVLMLCEGADNIVKLNAVHESRSDTALLLELATGGELQTFLDNEECLSEAHARICMREVLKALQFLHQRSIAHLDLKPQNILLAGERIEDGLKLCDFGISRVVAEGTNVREILGTPDYVAPEVLQYEPLSLLTDIWSVGVLAYVLLSGFSPFGGDTKQETFLNISQCALTFPDKLFEGVSAPAIDFIRRALRIKPSDRMSAAGCLEHTWLKDECNLDRQILLNIKQQAAAIDVEDTAEEDELDEEEEVEDEELELDEAATASDAAFEADAKTAVLQHVDNKILTCNGVKYMNGDSQGKPLAPNKPLRCNGARAGISTIPLATNSSRPLQSAAYMLTRRHSSDANKENKNANQQLRQETATIVTTTTATIANKCSNAESNATATATATATIIIPPNAAAAPAHNGDAGHQTVTLNGSDKQLITTVGTATTCIFPDAPTTPKVIRKAPHNEDETSPTSVKALVKKFQLEGSCGGGSNSGSRSSSPITTITTARQETQKPQQTHINGSSATLQRRSSANNAVIASTNAALVHQKSALPLRKSAAAATAPGYLSAVVSSTHGSHVHSYKTSCVLCVYCDASADVTDAPAAASLECRHSAAGTSPSNNSSSNNNNATASNAKQQQHLPPTTAYAHQHYHHHHHHHLHQQQQQQQHHHLAAAAHQTAHHVLHHVQKGSSAAQSLSLDQGIIC